jgi:hypothetical protein
MFKAKGKINQEIPYIDEKEAIYTEIENSKYIPDNAGYFRFYVDHYSRKIYVLFYSNKDELVNLIIGNNAETLSKKIIELGLTYDKYHLNYLGRELSKAEFCLYTGKPFIQDELWHY